jgi:acetyl-CoA carboxylase biotin carboxyl carrier protein
MATEVRAPLAGKVARLLVEPGNQVETEEPLLMLEALKMEIPVVSPVDGTLKEFWVRERQEVESDQVLAIVEEQ